MAMAHNVVAVLARRLTQNGKRREWNMAAEEVKLVKRTIYIAQHEKCEFRDVREKDPPREILCPVCKEWIEFEEHTWTGSPTFVEKGLNGIR